MSNPRLAPIDLHKLLSGAQLPALPQSAIRLFELAQNPDNGPADFAVSIEADPGLASQILKFVNSSYFGFSREISTIKLAITLVGIRTIKNFALWSAVFSLMPNPRCGPLELKGLWQDSLRRGLTARRLGELLGMKEAEEPFSAALLQDMAIPLLAKEAPDIYGRLIGAREGGRFRLSFLEKQVFGWTHAEAAGIMARQWNLPEDFAQLLESHVELDQWLSQSDRDPARLAVAVSALLPAVSDSQWWEAGKFEDCYQRLRPSGGPSLMDLLEKIDEQFAAFAPVLRIATPAKSLVASYQDALAPIE